jgi:hypothetical protein
VFSKGDDASVNARPYTHSEAREGVLVGSGEEGETQEGEEMKEDEAEQGETGERGGEQPGPLECEGGRKAREGSERERETSGKGSLA